MATRSERSDVQRNRKALLKAAAEVLAEDPAASMDDIAARAGLGRATMYRHVAGRPDLLHQLGQWALPIAQRAIAEARPAEGPPDVALRRVLEALVAEATDLRAILILGVGTEPAIRPQRDALLAPIAELIRRGQAEGSFRDDLEPQWATTALIILVRAALADGQSDPVATVWRTIVQGWLKPG